MKKSWSRPFAFLVLFLKHIYLFLFIKHRIRDGPFLQQLFPLAAKDRTTNWECWFTSQLFKKKKIETIQTKKENITDKTC